ncbi:MAG: hypothetical protein IT457_21115 [Planctomycetes bacterium]|nr:hypothetical protein [Planctomycetota bacterium]
MIIRTKSCLRLASLALVCGLVACAGGSSSAVLVTGLAEDFESTAPGALPGGFFAAETNGAGMPAAWAVTDGGAAGGARCLRVGEVRNTGDTYNLLLSREHCPADLAIDVKLRADAGEEDQGGGVVWRARGPHDYYVARWNPLEDNVRIYKVQGGVRTQFATAKVHVEPGQWHQLSITQKGARATVAFDGKPMLDIEDASFAGPGMVGFWTKADAAVSFDEFSVRALTN